ncbi:MAG: CDP-glycerol glycerophosphotransferase family protein [Bacteroidales bacterium]|nr:CDP-glycerol glycerophosphotransferase family protein [Bacteroidales bacterium]
MSFISTLKKMNVESPLRYVFRILFLYPDAIRTHIPFLYRWWIKRSRKRTMRGAQALQGKEHLEVAFVLAVPGMWKLDYVFRAMQQSEKYHPYIVIIPYTVYKGYSDEEIQTTLHRTEDFVKSRGFEYVIPYDRKNKRWVDIKKTLNPDIVFFTCPYKDMEPKYHTKHFVDRLTCFTTYGFSSMKLFKNNYDKLALNIAGAYFLETPMHKDFAKQYGHAKGRNCYVTGYPGCEIFLRDDYVPKEVWRPQDIRKKRIIWAPHHTIEGTFSVSTFLDVCDSMLHMAEQYHDKVQFAFKPHQLLKFKLIELWGEERTNAYYRKWQEMPNCQLEEGDYVDLFIGSDAMIHDSCSFTTEYLYQRKPVMYLLKNNPQEVFNDFGIMSFEQHYHGRTDADIERFIEKVVLHGDDPKKESREAFYQQYLGLYNGALPSENIMRVIENLIAGNDSNAS